MHIPLFIRKRGFTLIELLVVIAIIALLSSVVLASLTTARIKSRDARRISDMRQVRLALELYYDVTQSYPTTSALQVFTSTTTGSGIAILVNSYLPKLPSDPLPAATYFYCGMAAASSTDCSSGTRATAFVLGANLETDVTAQAVLTADTDKTVGTAFYGGNASCISSTAGPEKCLDVTS